MSLKLLIADDAKDVADAVAFGARMAWPGCEIVIAANGQEAVDRFAQLRPDLVVLDIAMPKLNGYEVCKQIRTISQVPILMLTVRDATLDKVRAFDLGADDYLTKPFDDLELVARLRALVRRANVAVTPPDTEFHCADLTVNFATHEVRVRGEAVRLAPIEYRLLTQLVRHAGTVLSHRFLLQQVWGAQYENEVNYLKVFMQRLRQKLGDDAEHPRYIQTLWGTGYRFGTPDDAH